MQGRTHTTRLRVRFGETDAAGIVYYPTFFTWFDVATHGLMRAAIGELRGPDKRPQYPIPLVESGARFVAPVYYDDLIEIRSAVVHLGTSSMRIEHVVTRDGTEAANGFEVRVVIGTGDGPIQAIPIPEEMRRALSEPVSTSDDAR